MLHRFLRLVSRLQRLMTLEDGQDMVEYAMVVGLIAFAVTASLKVLATGIGTAFSRIASMLSSSMT
jgi:pilus assembly protein Flp/PilA